MATDQERARQRDRLRFRCPSCENQVSGDDATCPACGAERPARGWVRVTELVVHDRFPEPSEPSETDLPTISGTPPILSGTPARPPVHRTVYLDAPGARAWFDPEANHTLGLVATFVGAFVLTTFLVLAVFASRTPDEPLPLSEGTVASAEPSAPEAEPVPHDEPPAPDLEEPAVPEAIRSLAGTYTGNVDGESASFDLRFEEGSVIRATITVGDGVETEATGTYRQEGDVVQLELEDQGAMTVSIYRGKISDRSLSGQMTSSSGGIRYFTATR